jgi:hypothetical protein
MEQELVHVPKPALKCSRLGCGRRRERVRMDFREREVPERETHSTVHLLLDALDLANRLPRIGAFVVAVLENETTGRRAADMIDSVVERFHGRLVLSPRRGSQGVCVALSWGAAARRSRSSWAIW